MSNQKKVSHLKWEEDCEYRGYSKVDASICCYGDNYVKIRYDGNMCRVYIRIFNAYKIRTANYNPDIKDEAFKFYMANYIEALLKL